jgi:uncharacterized protein (TIGR02147 family)
MEVKQAIEDLLALGLLVRDLASKKLIVVEGKIETSHDISSSAIRHFHKGMIQRASESIEEQDVSERHLNALSLKFDSKRMTDAKQRITQFIKDFNEEFESAEADTLYQLNTQFFALTEKDVGYAIQ